MESNDTKEQMTFQDSQNSIRVARIQSSETLMISKTNLENQNPTIYSALMNSKIKGEKR